MNKQDRNGVRTAADLERKYDLALTGMKKAVKLSEEGINKINAELESFVESDLKDFEKLQKQVDGKVTTYYYSGVPTLSNLPASEWKKEEYSNHEGDLYYDRSSGKAYIFEPENGVYSWKVVVDNDIAEALALANAASDTADSKRRVFVNQPTPPYDNGDLWFKNQEIYICQITKADTETYEEKDFIIATKYTDDTVANRVGDNLEIVRGTVTTIQESMDHFKIEIETTVKSVNNLQEETVESLERMSYTFGTNDLTIANSNDPVNTRINQQGLKVFTYNTLQSIFNHKGTGIQKLIVVGDAQLGNLSIVKTTDENGVACTDINYLVSNYQTLADLE
jgi:phage-related protein